MYHCIQKLVLILVAIPAAQIGWGQEINKTQKVYGDFREEVYEPRLWGEVVNADFGNGQHPPSGMFSDLDRVQHLVVSGPHCLDVHFRYSDVLRSIKFIALDSTDVTDRV